MLILGLIIGWFAGEMTAVHLIKDALEKNGMTWREWWDDLMEGIDTE